MTFRSFPQNEFLAEMSTFLLAFTPVQNFKAAVFLPVGMWQGKKTKKNQIWCQNSPGPTRWATCPNGATAIVTEATVAALLPLLPMPPLIEIPMQTQLCSGVLCKILKKKKKITKCNISIYYSGRTKKERKRNGCVALDPLGPTSGM